MDTASEATEDGLCSVVETTAGRLVAALDSITPLTSVWEDTDSDLFLCQ